MSATRPTTTPRGTPCEYRFVATCCEAEAGDELEWGVSDLAVADDGAVTVTLHAQRRAGR